MKLFERFRLHKKLDFYDKVIVESLLAKVSKTLTNLETSNKARSIVNLDVEELTMLETILKRLK